MVAAIALSLTLVPLLLALACVDLLRGRSRLPLARLAAFAWCWSCLETIGVLAAAGLWLVGRRRDLEAHYSLQQWWADRLLRSLRATCGLELDIEGAANLGDGPTVMLVRHASLADSLVTAWAVTERARLRPRFVLKKELLADPCLDIVGNRLPNCFLDRGAEDARPGASRRFAPWGRGPAWATCRSSSPRGPAPTTRSAPELSTASLGRTRNEHARLRGSTRCCHHVPPGRGSCSWVHAVESVVLGWHVGFEGLDTFGGIVAALGREIQPIRVRFESVPLAVDDLADPEAFERWLDDAWLRVDGRVSEVLARR